MNKGIMTTKEYPKHQHIGGFFAGFDQQVYLCDSFDPDAGFWMTNVLDHSKRKCVSGGALGRTWHWLNNEWRMETPEDPAGLEFFVVDTTVGVDNLEVKRVVDKELVGKGEWVGLFVYVFDAKKFVSRIQEAAVVLGRERSACAAV